MPTHYHADNVKEGIIHSDDCFDCYGSNTYHYFQNDFYEWERCTRCGVETPPVVMGGSE